MANPENIRDLLARFLVDQRVSVLATESNGQPHTSLMAFAMEKDLKSMVVATRCDTKKHKNLLDNPRVSLLADNRAEGFQNPQNALAVTITGTAEQMEGNARETAKEWFLRIHPEFVSLTKRPDCAIWRIRVESYQVVKGFDTLDIWRLNGR